MKALSLIVAASLMAGCSCGKTSFNADETARICVTLETCLPNEWSTGLFGTTLSDCSSRPRALVPLPSSAGVSVGLTTGMDPVMRDIYSCVLEAKSDCIAVNTCFGAAPQDAGLCLPQSFQQGSCSINGALSGCSADSFEFELDCTKYGGACGLQSAGTTSFDACTDIMCQGGALAACRGNVAEQCNANVVYGLLDCSAAGATCNVDPDAGAFCQGPKCSGSEPSCEGSTAISCAGGMQSRIDCSRAATFKRCDQGACVETGTACAVGTAATCTDATLSFCQDGTTTILDCTTIGFHGCSIDRCTP